MRIAYVSPRYAPAIGGVETVVAELATRVASDGHDVEVLTQESDRRLAPVEVIDGVRVRRFPIPLPSQNFAFAPSLWAYLKRVGTRYDVVHAHSYHALPALGAALSARRPLVFTPHYHGTGHSPLRSLLHKPYRVAGRMIFSRSNHVLCVSESEAALVRLHFPDVSNRVTVIPNGVDVAGLSQAQPYHYGRTVILSVGRLEEYKNVHLTIEAMQHLDNRFALYIIGQGPARADLEALTARLGLSERVSFLGRVDDVSLRRWYRTATVYTSMSSHEAFGITVREALASGTRIVASDIPAYRDVALTAGCSPVTLVSCDATPATLASTIRIAATMPQGTLPSALVASWDDVAAQTMSIYHGLVA